MIRLNKLLVILEKTDLIVSNKALEMYLNLGPFKRL